MIKAVFFDMDGTLVSYPEGEIPASAVDSLLEMRKKGILICAATGRCRVEMDTLGFLQPIPYDAVAVMNGQYCYTEEQELYLNTLAKEDVAAFMEYQKTEVVPAIVVEKNRQYVNVETDAFRDALAEIATALPPVGDMEGVEQRDICQLVPFCSAETVATLEARMPSSKAVRWSPVFVDIIAKKGGKVQGIEAILTHFGLSWDEVMAFGDGQNDIGMIEKAAIGVAMGNADEEVKAAADYVTAPAGENGVALALRHFGIVDGEETEL